MFSNCDFILANMTSVLDPDPYQETLIWIRVPKKNVINSHTNQPKV